MRKFLLAALAWLIGIPLIASLALAFAWNDTGGVDSGDAPSTPASLGGWAILVVGIALLVWLTRRIARWTPTGSLGGPDEGRDHV